MRKQKRFFAKHAKSCAMLVSVGIHAVLIIVALSFVAVTVIEKKKNDFVAKEVKRPKMALKKLQVPVNVKKKKVKKPKLNKRIVVKTPKTNVPDIKMPEISGVKGGFGGGVSGGLGGAGGRAIYYNNYLGIVQLILLHKIVFFAEGLFKLLNDLWDGRKGVFHRLRLLSFMFKIIVL